MCDVVEVFFCLFHFALLFFETMFLCAAVAVLKQPVDVASFKLKDPPTFAFQVLGVKVRATMAKCRSFLGLRLIYLEVL